MTVGSMTVVSMAGSASRFLLDQVGGESLWVIRVILTGISSQYVFGDSVTADSQGYQDGLKTGSSDARRGQSYDLRDRIISRTPAWQLCGDYREGSRVVTATDSTAKLTLNRS